MKTTITSIIVAALLTVSCRAADKLDQINLSRALREILPEHQLLAGDQSWNGGIQTNQVRASTLKANSAYFVFADPSNTSPAKLAEHIRDGIRKRCDLPDTGSRSWLRQMPREVSPDDFAEAYYHTGESPSDPSRYAVFSVRVIRLSEKRLGVSLNYTTLE